MPLNFTGSQRRNESFASSSYPSTRMGMAAQMRQAFTDAQGYAAKWEEYNKKKAAAKATDTPPSPPSRDLKLEALLPYLEGKKLVIVKAEEPNDVETAWALAQEFKLHVVLNGLTHSQAIYDKIAQWKVPVILGSIYDDPKESQRYDTVYRMPGELSKRGVKIAFASFRSTPGPQPALRCRIRRGVRPALRRSDEGADTLSGADLGRGRSAGLARRRQDRQRRGGQRRSAGCEDRGATMSSSRDATYPWSTDRRSCATGIRTDKRRSATTP